mgnify:CR=1 FL=1
MSTKNLPTNIIGSNPISDKELCLQLENWLIISNSGLPLRDECTVLSLHKLYYNETLSPTDQLNIDYYISDLTEKLSRRQKLFDKYLDYQNMDIQCK